MGDSVRLVTDEVVEPVSAIGVDEAITDPFPCANSFVDVSDDFERGLYAVVIDFASAESGGIFLAGEAEDVEGIFAG